mmetsp:Transcript_46266/g.144719  ORF Transcript_46266/g.144719 Transcript_46266/m.144719 type:complete len:821 (-) Transcript_46266:15-2477(-)
MPGVAPAARATQQFQEQREKRAALAAATAPAAVDEQQQQQQQRTTISAEDLDEEEELNPIEEGTEALFLARNTLLRVRARLRAWDLLTDEVIEYARKYPGHGSAPGEEGLLVRLVAALDNGDRHMNGFEQALNKLKGRGGRIPAKGMRDAMKKFELQVGLSVEEASTITQKIFKARGMSPLKGSLASQESPPKDPAQRTSAIPFRQPEAHALYQDESDASPFSDGEDDAPPPKASPEKDDFVLRTEEWFLPVPGAAMTNGTSPGKKQPRGGGDAASDAGSDESDDIEALFLQQSPILSPSKSESAAADAKASSTTDALGASAPLAADGLAAAVAHRTVSDERESLSRTDPNMLRTLAARAQEALKQKLAAEKGLRLLAIQKKRGPASGSGNLPLNEEHMLRQKLEQAERELKSLEKIGVGPRAGEVSGPQDLRVEHQIGLTLLREELDSQKKSRMETISRRLWHRESMSRQMMQAEADAAKPAPRLQAAAAAPTSKSKAEPASSSERGKAARTGRTSTKGARAARGNASTRTPKGKGATSKGKRKAAAQEAKSEPRAQEEKAEEHKSEAQAPEAEPKKPKPKTKRQLDLDAWRSQPKPQTCPHCGVLPTVRRCHDCLPEPVNAEGIAANEFCGACFIRKHHIDKFREHRWVVIGRAAAALERALEEAESISTEAQAFAQRVQDTNAMAAGLASGSPGGGNVDSIEMGLGPLERLKRQYGMESSLLDTEIEAAAKKVEAEQRYADAEAAKAQIDHLRAKLGFDDDSDDEPFSPSFALGDDVLESSGFRLDLAAKYGGGDPESDGDDDDDEDDDDMVVWGRG